MKKIISVALAIGVALTLCGSVFAEPGDASEEPDIPVAAGETEIIYGLEGDNTYMINISPEISFDSESTEDELRIAVSDVKVMTGQTLNIYISSLNGFNLARHEQIPNPDYNSEKLSSEAFLTTSSYIPYEVLINPTIEQEEAGLEPVNIAESYRARLLMQQAALSMLAPMTDDEAAGYSINAVKRIKLAPIMTVAGEGWLADDLCDQVTLTVYTDEDSINQATLSGEHTDLLTFTVVVEEFENVTSAESRIRDTD